MKKFFLVTSFVIFVHCSPHHDTIETTSNNNRNAIDAPSEEMPVTFTEVKTKFLQPYCLNCHNSTNSKGGVNLNDEENLFALNLITEGKPEASVLYDIVVSGDMPPNRKVDEKSLDLLAEWIRSLPTP